jgi:spore germination protein KA
VLGFLRRFLLRRQTSAKASSASPTAQGAVTDNGAPPKKGTLMAPGKPEATQYPKDLATGLEDNLAKLRQLLGDSPDLVMRQFTIGSPSGKRAAIIFIDGLVDKNALNRDVLRPLMRAGGDGPGDGPGGHSGGPKMNVTAQIAEANLLTVDDLKTSGSLAEMVGTILDGQTALLFDGERTGLIISARGWTQRALIEPETEVTVKGPRDGFNETMRTNTALLRRRISHPGLTFEPLHAGRKTRTDMCIAYLKGVAEPSLVKEVKTRIERIDIDMTMAGGSLEELIQDDPYSIFSTVGYTERPDTCAARLLEGRVAIIIDGTPVVDTVPSLFIENFQSMDDYVLRAGYSTAIRWFRFAAFAASLLLPALYIAFVTFHPELLPGPLLFTIAAANEGTPFSPTAEIIILTVIFEILRQAGIRIPRPIGQAVSIVGALVIGDAMVSAGVVGAPAIIVVALTAISAFVAPKLEEASLILRYVFIVLSAVLGMAGVVCAAVAVFLHLASLRSFGVPYMAPLAPVVQHDLKDTLIRAPWWAMLTRPKLIARGNRTRQRVPQIPLPPDVDADSQQEKGET